MASNRFGYWPLVMGTVLLLSGCVGGAGEDDTGEPPPATAGARPSRADIEAPSTFQTTERGLWDGRPSLGGVWIAMPDVTLPQRVLIRNTSNGKSIVGALFRRERANPGPRIMISSDAADKLGILAGQPTELYVVALTREQPQEEAPHVSDESTGAGTEEAPADASADEVAAAAAAAIAETNGEPQPTPETRSPSSFGRRNQPAPAAETPAEGADGATDAAAAATAAASGEAATEPQPVPETRSPSSFGRRTPREPAAETSAEAATAASAAPGDVTTAPLDGTAGAATAPAPAAAAPAPATGEQRTYVQAGTFTTEANAQSAADAFVAQGLEATTRRQAGANGTFWIVLVGPANTRAERNRTLEKVKGMGYPDAFLVRG